MKKETAIKIIENYFKGNVIIKDGKAYQANPSEFDLFADMPLSALGSGNNELYEAFDALEEESK